MFRRRRSDRELMQMPSSNRVRAHTAVLVFTLVLTACSGEKRAQFRPQPVPVRLAEAQLEDLPLTLKALGTVTPLNTVAVRSRIDGELVRVLFEEGQAVKAGQLLAEIDPRPYEVALAQAEGTQQENLVQLENAEQELKRQRDLVEKNFISKQALSNQEALVRQFRARLATSEAAVASAKLDLEYTRIIAPISGRLGLRNIDRGNLIRSGDPEGLVTITQMEPMNVVFTIPETEVTEVIEAHRSERKLPVEAWDRSETRRLASGELTSLDNRIDTSTGTLRLKAEFSNEDGRLFPNQFVNVRLAVRTIEQAVVIPGAAVQFGSQGNYVFVVHENKVAIRPVTLGRAAEDRLVIAKGLKAGEHVVLEGLDRLREGSTVQVISDTASAAAEADTAS
jgi:membrane fusion protein, multidrug efflux system